LDKVSRFPGTWWLVGAAAVAAAATYFFMQGQVRTANERAELLQQTVTTKERSLLGQTTYVRYLQEGKRQLTAQQKFLAATVRQPYAVTQVIDQSVLGFHSTGTVAIWYSVEYSFGFDLAPDSFEITSDQTGITVTVGKPRLVATPAVTNLRHKVLTGGLLTDEKAAALKLYAEASKRRATRDRACNHGALRAAADDLPARFPAAATECDDCAAHRGCLSLSDDPTNWKEPPCA
jgi:hypothetical protein